MRNGDTRIPNGEVYLKLDENTSLEDILNENGERKAIG